METTRKTNRYKAGIAVQKKYKADPELHNKVKKAQSDAMKAYWKRIKALMNKESEQHA